MPIRRLLETTELFATLPPVALATLSERAELRHYARNQVIFRHGDPATELFVVDRGRIAVAQPSGDGRESVVAVLEGGSLLGEMPLFDDAPRSADGASPSPTPTSSRSATSRCAPCCAPSPRCCG